MSLGLSRPQVPITISWHRENGNLPKDRSYQERGSGTLVLNHVQYDDSGIYVCHARNGSEVAEKKLTLTISCEYCRCESVGVFGRESSLTSVVYFSKAFTKEYKDKLGNLVASH